MRPTAEEKRQKFRQLHQAGCFIIPNPWDRGSALALQGLGFSALASTSSGMAWSCGLPDNGVALERVLEHLQALADAVDLPLNADFENGFADAPEEVADNVARALETGIAGLSVEDSTGDPDAPLYDYELAIERILAAREAIDASGADVLLTARSEGFFVGRPDLDETLRRLTAFAEAGADCLYAPGIRKESEIEALVQAVQPKPLNVLTFGLSLDRLAELGVRRISVGGGLARVAWGGFLQAAGEMASHGSFESLKRAVSGSEMNALFTGRSKR